MSNLCSSYSVRGCPASYYMSCTAYKENKNCWETAGERPCCSRGEGDCRDCSVRHTASTASLLLEATKAK